MGLAAFNRLRRQRAEGSTQEPQAETEVVGAQGERPDNAEPGTQADGQGLDPAADEQAHRKQLMDAIEQATGKRPGANTKTETLEQRYAELSEE